MTLNIKDPEVYELATALNALTGETLTGAVKEALRERLGRVQRKEQAAAKAADLLAIGRRCASTLQGQAVDHGTFLYDEQGLPK